MTASETNEDHPAVGANSVKSLCVVDAVVDFQLFGSTRENLVGRLSARRELGKLGGVGLGREAPLREQRPVWKSRFVGSRPCVAWNYWLSSTLMPTPS